MADRSSELEPHPFNADQPIAAAADDLLGRAGFAHAIADAVATWEGQETLVLAIYGSWGSGKSSVKNMVLERLSDTDATPFVIQFTPWQWAAQQQLAVGFFDEIEVALGKADPSKTGKARAKRWALYAARLKVGTLAATGLKSALSVLLVAAGVLAVLAGASVDWVAKLGQAFGAILVTLGLFLGFSERFSKALSEMFAAEAEHHDRTVEDVRSDLKEDLAALPRPLLVIVDDIDRLTPHETRLLMQLVKANADFPNLIYLLLMDRGVVEAALSTGGIRGRDYIEKIVQVAFDLPVLDTGRVQSVLFADLNQILQRQGVGDRFEQAHWQNVYFGGLRHYFRSLRDVRRFSGALSFDLSLVLIDDVLEVNPIDLIAIVALRMFEPDIYSALPSMKELLTKDSSTKAITGPRDDDVKAGVEALSALAKRATEEQINSLLTQLFPRVGWVFGANRMSGFEDGWYRDLRVCHEDVFDRYFQLALPEGDLSQRDIDQVKALADDAAALTAHFRQVQERGLLPVLFERLEAYKQTLPIERAVEIITAIFNVGEHLPDTSPGMFSISPSLHATRVIHWFVAQEDDRSRRLQILTSALAKTDGLVLPVHLVSLETRSDDQSDENADFYLVDADGQAALKLAALDKIRHAAGTGELARSPQLGFVLFRWRDWAGLEEPQEWCRSLIQTPDGFLTLIRGFVGEVHTTAMGSYASSTTRRIRLKEIETFVVEASLRAGLDSIRDVHLTDADAVAVDALQAAFNRRAEGKPDDSFHV